MYFNLKDIRLKTPFVAALFGASIAVFLFYPATGNQIAITTGVNRVIFLLASIMLVTAFYKFSQHSFIPKGIQYPLEQFGIATYGVYLLHPLVNSYAGYALRKIGLQDPAVLFAVVVIITIALAIASFKFFEIRIVKYGKEVTSNGSKLWMIFNYVRPTNRSSGRSVERR